MEWYSEATLLKFESNTDIKSVILNTSIPIF